MKQFLTIVFLIIFIGMIKSQNTIETVFDFNFSDFVSDIVELNDGGFLIIGFTGEENEIPRRQLLIRLNENGDTLWSRKDSIRLGAYAVEFDSNYFYFVGANVDGAMLTKTNSNFEIIWQHIELNAENSYYTYSDIQKLNNDKLIYRRGVYPDDYNYAPYIGSRIVDTSGIYIWGGAIITETILKTSDSNFLTTGPYDYYNPESVFLKKWPSNESYSNQPIYKTNVGFMYPPNMVQSSDTVFIFGNNGQSENVQLIMASIDSGVVLQNKSYIFPEKTRTKSVCKTSDGKILILGVIMPQGKENMIIFKTNLQGDSISTSIVDKYDKLRPRKILCRDGFMYIIGNLWDYNSGGNFYYKDIYFLKAPIDTLMVGSNQVKQSTKINWFSVSPNPANTKVIVSMNIEKWKQTTLRVTNINGKEIYTKIIAPGITKHQIEIDNWQTGICIFSIFEEGVLLQTEKVVVVK